MIPFDHRVLTGAFIVLVVAIIGLSWTILISRQGDELTVDGISMQPTLNPGDKVRLITDIDRPYQQADLVAVNFKTRERLIVKRIIALEGDELKRIDGVVHVNGRPLIIPGWPEDRRVADRQWKILGIQLKTYDNRVPKNNIVVMGDHTERSYDSGDFGMLSLPQIAGLVQQ